MTYVTHTLAKLQLAQIGWVVPDIHAAVKFLSNALGIAGFPRPEQVRAQDLNMTYYGKVVAGEWLTTQTFNGGTFIELVQPLSGNSMFHDYLAKYPAGGTQHMAFRLPVRISIGSPAIFAIKAMSSSAKLTIQLHEWFSSTRTKPWGWQRR